ncbi:ABC transporter permease [Dysgonomonas sp. Marseille-P4677]|uniref:ABC transporter permease n=1 Tax=Dysgonomonas sp. Marseille-P4677 TaxID=2364790 RepID=UPI001912D19E|nr:ABC transporter permease [Dysgonomonas sp. Marseille-P4677]MBK5720941.1 ABC transporter permease [Dysgonomonas sp. Marseille-P4677]
MNLSDIFKSFKRSRLFMVINVCGLTIGLAVAIMLILFVQTELSFDKHFKDSDRIISLNTVMELEGQKNQMPICTNKATTEVPAKVPGIEASTQIYKGGKIEVVHEKERFLDLAALYTKPSFFDVFDMKFVEGSKTALSAPHTAIITSKYAKIIFGKTEQALTKKISINNLEYTILAVVEELPKNTHFTFDILLEDDTNYPSIEYFTFYKIAKEMSVDDVSKSIEKEYTKEVKAFLEGFSGNAYGVTEKLTDIYLHTKSVSTLGKKSQMSFVWLLSLVAILILLLAITNFVNLFIAQGETRSVEIGVRKANGAEKKDIIKQFFSEIAIIVLLAFILAFVIISFILPYFAKLIKRDIELSQLLNPTFLVSIIILYILTIILSASYPSFYLAKFNPLDILAKRLQFSKRRLAAVIVIFQSVVSIVLLSYIFVVTQQTIYLQSLPTGYNPKGVMMVYLNKKSFDNLSAIKQELQNIPSIIGVSTAGHTFGRSGSGQGIKLLGDEKTLNINEYRMEPGICEIMGLELIEGKFFSEDDPKNKESIILNEAAIQMLGLSLPVVGTTVDYKGQNEIIGVVKNFIYGQPQDEIAPIVFSSAWGTRSALYIKFNDNLNRNEAKDIVEKVFRKIDSEFILSPTWSEDVYNDKFDDLKTQSKILSYAAILSIFISMLGLLAIHTFTTARRTKEIAIRRVNGASVQAIFITLSINIFKWISIAAAIAIPIIYYISSNWLNNYTNRISLEIGLFAGPILLQFIIAIITTSGVSLNVLSKNPVESLKSE